MMIARSIGMVPSMMIDDPVVTVIGYRKRVTITQMLITRSLKPFPGERSRASVTISES
jgi:hypothetical protein